MVGDTSRIQLPLDLLEGSSKFGKDMEHILEESSKVRAIAAYDVQHSALLTGIQGRRERPHSSETTPSSTASGDRNKRNLSSLTQDVKEKAEGMRNVILPGLSTVPVRDWLKKSVKEFLRVTRANRRLG